MKLSWLEHMVALEIIQDGQTRCAMDIANKIGCTTETVYHTLKKLNIQPTKRPTKHHKG